MPDAGRSVGVPPPVLVLGKNMYPSEPLARYRQKPVDFERINVEQPSLPSLAQQTHETTRTARKTGNLNVMNTNAVDTKQQVRKTNARKAKMTYSTSHSLLHGLCQFGVPTRSVALSLRSLLRHHFRIR